MPDSAITNAFPQAKAFVSCLIKSNLLSEEQIREALDRICCENASVESVHLAQERVAEHFVSYELLTPWQTQKLLNGKHKGFYLGNYILREHLGSGGMGNVYLGEHSLTGLRRAIKVLPRHRIAERSYLSRFYREGRAVAAMHHQNIVRIYDLSEQDETPYMVMEFIPGMDLWDVVTDNGPLEYPAARQAIVDAACGLAHAHDQGLIHRDVKPANLFRTDAGPVKILDMGLALITTENSLGNLTLQHDEKTMGTADYLSPEQAIHSHHVDHRADIYSLGCTLYYLLTGTPPFHQGNLAKRIAMHQTAPPPNILDARPDCPTDLDTAIRNMLQKRPEDRFQNCHDIVDLLQDSATQS